MTKKHNRIEPKVYRRQILIRPNSSIKSPTSKRIAEVAGGVTADCATICCFFPYAAANVLTLVVLKVPSRLCRKALKGHRKRVLTKKGLLPIHLDTSSSNAISRQCSFDETIKVFHNGKELTLVIDGIDLDDDFMELEKEMSTKFSGFWRSPSQHEI